jgi:hypothetical protein
LPVMDSTTLSQRDAKHPEPVLGSSASTFCHPHIARAGDTNRSDTSDRGRPDRFSLDQRR